MNLVSLTCPNCKASLSVENGIDTFFCMYCGNKIILSGMSDAAYDARVKVKQFQHEERILSQQHNHELNIKKIDAQIRAEESKSDFKSIFLVFGILLLMLLVFVLIGTWPIIKGKMAKKDLNKLNSQVTECIKEGNYKEAQSINSELKEKISDVEDGSVEMFTWLNTYYNNEYDITRIARTKAGKTASIIQLAVDSDSLSDMKPTEAINYLAKTGFVNISVVTTSTLNIFSIDDIKDISINGKTEFSAGTQFKDDAEVIVYVYKN